MLAVVIDLTGIEMWLSQPPEIIFLKMLLYVGWIPVVWVLIWGFLQLYLDSRQGKFAARQKYITLAVDVPRTTVQTPKAVENIFTVLYGTKSVITFKEKWSWGKFWLPVSFDVVSSEGYIQFYIYVSAMYRDLIEAAIYSQYPDAEIAEVSDYTSMLPDEWPNDTYELFGGELKIEQDQFMPIKTWPMFEHTATKDEVLKDPINHMLEIMAGMRKGEHFWFQLTVRVDPPGTGQVAKAGQEFILKTFGKEIPQKKGKLETLFAPISWFPKEAMSQISDLLAGGSSGDDNQKFIFPNITAREKTQVDAVSQKIAKQMYAVKIRWAYIARHEAYMKGGRNSQWKGYINIFAHNDLNNFKYDPDTMPRDDYFWMVWEYRAKQRKLTKALKSRSWALGTTPGYLNVEELATLWHFPTIETKAPLIQKTDARRVEAPTILPTPGAEGEDLLPTEPLIEVDAQGKPIEYGAPKTAAPATEPATATVVYDGPPSTDGDDLSDILPTGPMIEPDEAPSTDEGASDEDDEMEQPLLPPNLPV